MRALARARAWTLVSSKLYARLDGKFSGATASAGGTVRYFRNGYIAEDCADFQWIRGWDILMEINGRWKNAKWKQFVWEQSDCLG